MFKYTKDDRLWLNVIITLWFGFIGNFLEYIQFHKIPANVLMKDIHPLGVVPYHIVMNALAYQVSSLTQNDDDVENDN